MFQLLVIPADLEIYIISPDPSFVPQFGNRILDPNREHKVDNHTPVPHLLVQIEHWIGLRIQEDHISCVSLEFFQSQLQMHHKTWDTQSM